MMTLPQLRNAVRNLCTPAFVYFMVSAGFIAATILQNLIAGNNSKYLLGTFECPVVNCAMVFVAKLVYVAFWTWMLDLMCRDGHSAIAWIILLFPLIMMFLMIAAGMILSTRNANNNGNNNKKNDKVTREQFSAGEPYLPATF